MFGLIDSLKRNMGVKNYLIDGVSCAGKTTVCDELQRRGYQVIHGDEAVVDTILEHTN